ncbi:Mbov_0400 family ICE element protein [Metamycoplasma equirhinis]|uniref:Mbov_0400 family ICE element protein n=1 Tax=Metamycoplasma equirhinis TaxID=92402 RepID=UPI003593705D
MSLDLWKPLKINNPILEDIFNQPIDGKILPNGNIQVHPLIIFENKQDKTYYCIRLQSATPSTIKNNILIDNSSYQKDYYWKFHKGVAVTKDIFIIDKELLESNINQTIYQNTLKLDENDKKLILNDLEKRINSIPPDLNILKISNNLQNNLVLYTREKLIQNQLNSTISPKNKLIDQEVKDYYSKHFDKNEFLKDVNLSNIEYTQEALKDIKLCIDKEQNIANEYFFQYELDKDSGNYFIVNQEENTNSNEESKEETKGLSR